MKYKLNNIYYDVNDDILFKINHFRKVNVNMSDCNFDCCLSCESLTDSERKFIIYAKKNGEYFIACDELAEYDI